MRSKENQLKVGSKNEKYYNKNGVKMQEKKESTISDAVRKITGNTKTFF